MSKQPDMTPFMAWISAGASTGKPVVQVLVEPGGYMYLGHWQEYPKGGVPMAERIELSEEQVRMLRHIEMGALLPGRGEFVSVYTRAGLDLTADLWSMGLVEVKYGTKARITPAGRLWLKEHGHG